MWLADCLELPFQELRKTSMAAVETLQDFGIQRRNPSLRNGKNSCHQQVSAGLRGEQYLLAREIRLRQHAGRIRQQPVPRARDRDRLHRAPAATPRTRSVSISSPESSSIFNRDIKKQIVLSAP